MPLVLPQVNEKTSYVMKFPHATNYTSIPEIHTDLL